MSDKSFFENDPTLRGIIEQHDELVKNANAELYNQIMAKPLIHGQDLLDLPSEPNNYLIENFLWHKDVAIIIAQEKIGKSIFVAQMAYALTCGDPFLDTYDVARPLKVLYVQAEGSIYETKDRLVSTIGEGGLRWNKDNWRHYYPPALALDTEDGYNEMVTRIEQDSFRPDVIIIDPLYMGMEGDLNDNKAARRFCRNIRRLQAKFDCAIIIIHHEHRPKKSQMGDDIQEGDNSIMGSFVWKSFPSHVMRLTGDKRQPERELTCVTQRNDNVVKDLQLKITSDPLMFIVDGQKACNSTEEAVLQNIKFNKQICAMEVAKQTGIKEQVVRNCFSKLKKKSLIRIAEKSGKKVLYEAT